MCERETHRETHRENMCTGGPEAHKWKAMSDAGHSSWLFSTLLF